MNKNKKNNQSEKKGRTSRVYIGYGMFGGTQIPKIYEFSKFNGEICMKNRNLWVTVRKFPESNRLYSHYNPEGKEYYLLVKHRCTPNSLVLSSLYLRMAFSSPKHSTTGEPSQNLWKL